MRPTISPTRPVPQLSVPCSSPPFAIKTLRLTTISLHRCCSEEVSSAPGRSPTNSTWRRHARIEHPSALYRMTDGAMEQSFKDRVNSDPGVSARR